MVILFIPLNNIDSPVPPPIATIFGPLFNFLLRYNVSKIVSSALPLCISNIDTLVFCQPLKNKYTPNTVIKIAKMSVGNVIAIFRINSMIKYTGRKSKNIINPIVINKEPIKINANQRFTSNPGSSQIASFILSLKVFFILFIFFTFFHYSAQPDDFTFK